MEPGIEISTGDLRKQTKYSTKHDAATDLDMVTADKLVEEGQVEIIVPVPFYKRFTRQLIGDFLAISSAFVFCLASIFMRMGYKLTGSDHMAVRYIIQIILTSSVIKYKGLNPLGDKGTRKLLTLRGLSGSFLVFLGAVSIRLINPSDYVTILNSSVILTAVFSRIFLKEKLTIVHIFALFLTIFGVIAIFRPAFLFPAKTSDLNQEQDLFNIFNSSSNHTNDNSKNETSEMSKIIGISLSVLMALLIAFAQILMKKLSSVKVHYAIVNFYPSIIGLPLAIIMSTVAILTGISHKNFAAEKSVYLTHFAYSICGGICGTTGITLLSMAFDYEDATKIAIVKTIDIFFSFILQLIILNIKVDLLGVIGAINILVGSLVVIVFKLIENKYKKLSICKCFFFKF